MKRKRLHRTGLWEMGQPLPPAHVTYAPLRLNTAPNSLSGWQLKCQFRQHQQTRCACFCVNFTEWSVNRNTQTSRKCKFPLRLRINLKRPHKDEYYYHSVPAADVGTSMLLLQKLAQYISLRTFLIRVLYMPQKVVVMLKLSFLRPFFLLSIQFTVADSQQCKMSS